MYLLKDINLKAANVRFTKEMKRVCDVRESVSDPMIMFNFELLVWTESPHLLRHTV